MPLNSTDFNQILNIAPSGHVKTIQNIIKDTSPSQEHQNHHQLQPKIYKCHQSLRGFLMPSNLSDFNQISNIAPSGHMQTIHNVIKDMSPSQEHQNHHHIQSRALKTNQHHSHKANHSWAELVYSLNLPIFEGGVSQKFILLKFILRHTLVNPSPLVMYGAVYHVILCKFSCHPD